MNTVVHLRTIWQRGLSEDKSPSSSPSSAVPFLLQSLDLEGLFELFLEMEFAVVMWTDRKTKIRRNKTDLKFISIFTKFLVKNYIFLCDTSRRHRDTL